MSEDPRSLLETAGIQWARDWDAVTVGLVLGVLGTLAIQAIW